MNKKYIAPSLICMDLLNIRQEVKTLESLGIEMLHVDIIDGIFSPDMPLGINTVKALKENSNLIFDVHLMSVNNAPFIDMLAECKVERICFHTEYEPRPAVLIRKIKAAGIKVGIAISPETTIESLKYLLPLCDFALIMRIDAGYAHLSGQQVYPCSEEKILKIREYNPSIEIEADGRVGFEETKSLLKCGVDIFVSGTKGIFSRDNSIEENYKKLKSILKENENV